MIGAVSKRWWEVIAATPVLWSRIQYGVPSPGLALQKSLQCPLDIKMEDNNRCSAVTQEDFAKLLAPHMHRIKSLKWRGDDCSPLPSALASITLLILETLDLCTVRHFSLDLPSTPQLRSLRLSRVDAVLKALTMPMLTRLSITSMSPSMLPAISDLIAVFAECRSLEEVELTDLEYTRQAVLPANQPTLILPNLKVLKLMDIVETVVLYFLHIIQADNILGVGFGSRDGADFSTTTVLHDLRALHPSKSLILAAFNNNTEGLITIEVEPSYLKISLSGEYSANILLPGGDLARSMGLIIRAMHLDIVVEPMHLYLSAEDADEDPEIDISFLDRLPQLVEFDDAHWNPNHLATVLDHLSTPDAHGEYPCQHLHTIWLSAPNWHFEDLTREEFSPILQALRRFHLHRKYVPVHDHGEEVFKEGMESFMGYSIYPEE